MKEHCGAPHCGKEARLVVKQMPLCHAHYTLLRLHLDLRGQSLHEFEGDLRDLLGDPQHYANPVRLARSSIR